MSIMQNGIFDKFVFVDAVVVVVVEYHATFEFAVIGDAFSKFARMQMTSPNKKPEHGWWCFKENKMKNKQKTTNTAPFIFDNIFSLHFFLLFNSIKNYYC